MLIKQNVKNNVSKDWPISIAREKSRNFGDEMGGEGGPGHVKNEI